MARKISPKNIIGLAFLAPILVLIVFMAVLSYVFLVGDTNLGRAALILIIPFLAVPTLVLIILSISFTAKNVTMKWLWPIPVGTTVTAIILSTLTVTHQIHAYRSKCEQYASYGATLNYLKNSQDSVLKVNTKEITNPGQDAYDILVDLVFIKSGESLLILSPLITWSTDDCSLTINYNDITCERTVSRNNYKMRYETTPENVNAITNELNAKLFRVENGD